MYPYIILNKNAFVKVFFTKNLITLNKLSIKEDMRKPAHILSIYFFDVQIALKIYKDRINSTIPAIIQIAAAAIST